MSQQHPGWEPLAALARQLSARYPGERPRTYLRQTTPTTSLYQGGGGGGFKPKQQNLAHLFYPDTQAYYLNQRD